MRIHLITLLLLTTNQLAGQNLLRTKFEHLSDSIKGNLGISALHIETGKSISFNGNKKFPMQSVYKFPIAMVMLHQIDAGEFSLEDPIKIDKDEYIPKAGHSPLRDKYPNGVTLKIKDILEYNVSKSDGSACDVLLRLLGGTDQVQKRIRALGVQNIAISTTEMVQISTILSSIKTGQLQMP